jgi:cell division protein FtsW (lipid II flippase)
LLPIAALVLGLVLLGGDLGTSLILMAIVSGLLFVAGSPLRVFVLLGTFCLSVIAFMTIQRSARLSRFESFLDPFADSVSRMGSDFVFRRGKQIILVADLPPQAHPREAYRLLIKKLERAR